MSAYSTITPGKRHVFWCARLLIEFDSYKTRIRLGIYFSLKSYQLLFNFTYFCFASGGNGKIALLS